MAKDIISGSLSYSAYMMRKRRKYASGESNQWQRRVWPQFFEEPFDKLRKITWQGLPRMLDAFIMEVEKIGASVWAAEEEQEQERKAVLAQKRDADTREGSNKRKAEAESTANDEMGSGSNDGSEDDELTVDYILFSRYVISFACSKAHAALQTCEQTDTVLHAKKSVLDSHEDSHEYLTRKLRECKKMRRG